MARLDDGVCVDARLVVGAVTTTPARVSGAEELLRGQRIRDGAFDAATLAEVGRLAAATIEPIDDIRGAADYKRLVAGVQAERAVAQAVSTGATR
jgi:carbon-monoxide dehydrogenase medium subunit